MKKLYIMLVTLISFNSYAQDPQLFENDWYLQKLILNDVERFPPNLSIEPATGRIYFYDLDHFAINYCDGADSSVTFNVPSTFSIEDDPIILLGDCIHPQNLTFDANYFSIFYTSSTTNNPFSYIIVPDGANLFLEVTNPLGNKAIYGSQQLAFEDFEEIEDITLYPNPVQETLHIRTDNVLGNLQATIYNLEGRLVLSEKIPVTNGVLNLGKLVAGVYILKIVGKQGQLTARRFIKK